MSDNKMETLLDMISRIDERVKLIQEKQNDLEDRFDEAMAVRQEKLQKLAVLEAKVADEEALRENIHNCQGNCKASFYQMDKRVSSLETDSGRSEDRWNKIFGFIIQLVWVLLAAWLLLKLNLQAPAVP